MATIRILLIARLHALQSQSSCPPKLQSTPDCHHHSSLQVLRKLGLQHGSAPLFVAVRILLIAHLHALHKALGAMAATELPSPDTTAATIPT
ncbi:unnamed protein product [Closterium sp. NIES-54]